MRLLGARSILILLVVLALSPIASSAAPPPRSPDGSNGDESDETETVVVADGLELPALTITPEEIDEPGFGVANARHTSLEDDARTLNSLLGGAEEDVQAVQETLEDAGWTQSYFAALAIASGDDPSLYGTYIFNSLTEFEDESGAAEGYDLLREANAASGFLRANSDETVGDESTVTRASATATDGRPLNYLDIVFRVGPVLAEIYIAEYSDADPELETIMSIAEAVADRVAEADATTGSGLSRKTLVLDGAGMITNYSYYNRRDGITIPTYGRSVADARADDRFFRDAGVIDVYIVSQSMPLTEEENDSLTYLIYSYRFDDEDNAEAAIGDWSGDWLEAPSVGYEDVEAVPDAEIVGDESAWFSHTFEANEDVGHDGYRVYFRVAETVVSVIANSAAGVSESSMQEIAEAAAECMSSDEPCAPLRVTEESLSGR